MERVELHQQKTANFARGVTTPLKSLGGVFPPQVPVPVWEQCRMHFGSTNHVF